MMVVFKTSTAAFPEPAVIPSLVIVGLHPIGIRKRRARPVSVVPPIVMALRIPVAFDPDELRTGPRDHAIVAWRRRRPDGDADRDLRVCRQSRHQQKRT